MELSDIERKKIDEQNPDIKKQKHFIIRKNAKLYLKRLRLMLDVLSPREISNIFTSEQISSFVEAVCVPSRGFPGPRQRKTAAKIFYELGSYYGAYFLEAAKMIESMDTTLKMSIDYRKLMFQRYEPEYEEDFKRHFDVMQSLFATGAVQTLTSITSPKEMEEREKGLQKFVEDTILSDKQKVWIACYKWRSIGQIASVTNLSKKHVRSIIQELTQTKAIEELGKSRRYKRLYPHHLD